MAAEFASLDGQNQNIPFSGASVDPMTLTTPNSIITGTTAGLQALGAQNIKTDAINKRIVVNDGITNRVSFGKIGAGINDWGLKVSQANTNVDTAIASQLIFNSSQDTFKIVTKLSGTFSISGGSSGGTGSFFVPHNLGYEPLTLGSVTMGTNTLGINVGSVLPLPILIPGITGIQNSTTSLPVAFLMMAIQSIDTTNFYIGWSLIFGGHTVAGTVTLYVLQETAN